MQNQDPKFRLTYSQVCVFMGWFLFQEQNDIHTEQTSLSQTEIKFSNILNAAATKMKDSPKGSYILIAPEEAIIAYNWFKNLSDIFIDEKDRKMFACLNVFVEKE